MTELRQYTLVEELAESIRIESAHPRKKRSMKLLPETRRALIAAIYSCGVKRSWVRLREEKLIYVGKDKDQSWSLSKLRAALRACREIAVFSIRRAGKS